MRRLYIDEEKSLIELSKVFNVKADTLRRYLDQYNIKSRGRRVTQAQKEHLSRVKTGIEIKNHKIEVKCAWCGQSKKVKPYIFKRNKRFFCDRDCQARWESKNKVGENNPQYSCVTVCCAWCGKEIKQKKGVVEKSITGRFFCKPKHQGKWWVKNKSGENSNRWKGGLITIECVYCGKAKQIKPKDLCNMNFCNTKCFGQWKSENLIGDKAFNWQGGISFEPYASEFNENLKEAIRQRDGYKCQRCSCSELENMEKLSIHHIDYDKKNCHPNNLIALCHGCHVSTNSNRQKWTKYFQKKIKNIIDSSLIQLNFRFKKQNIDKILSKC